MEKTRCAWVGSDPDMIRYHDTEWGVPCRDDKLIFEYIMLDTFQAGLSWSIMIRKRENFRKAFDNFDWEKIARYKEAKVAKLLADAGIIRHRGKIEAAIQNAKAFQEVRKEFGSFATYIWQFVDDVPQINKRKKLSDLPAVSPVGDALSKDMKKRGFRFAGPTITYAFMQGAGLVNDHTVDCFRYKEVSGQPRY